MSKAIKKFTSVYPDRTLETACYSTDVSLETSNTHGSSIIVFLRHDEGANLGHWLLDHCAAAPASTMPVCPKCGKNDDIEVSRFEDSGTHFCGHCSKWFTPSPALAAKDAEIERLKRCCADQQDFFRMGCRRADEWREKYQAEKAEVDRLKQSRDDLRKQNEELKAELGTEIVGRNKEFRAAEQSKLDLQHNINLKRGEIARLREALKAADALRAVWHGTQLYANEQCAMDAYDVARAKCNQGTAVCGCLDCLNDRCKEPSHQRVTAKWTGKTPQGEVKSGEDEVPGHED